MLDTYGGEYWELNDTGAISLQFALDGSTTDITAAYISSIFEVTQSEAKADAEFLLWSLKNAGLIIDDDQSGT